MPEKSRILNEDETREILDLVPSQIDEQLFIDYFANRSSRKARFKPYDILKVPKGKVFNKEVLDTTVGRYVWNLFMLDYDLLELIGYQNFTMNIGKVQDKVDPLLMEDKITGERYAEFLNKVDFLYGMARYLTPSLTLNILEPTPKANALKKELIKENQEAIKNGDFITMGEIEKKVLKVAEEEIKDIPDFEIYDSGAGGGKGKAFNNAFKNMTYFRGAIRSLADNDYYYLSTSSLLDGIPPEEQDKYADITVQGSYGRAVGTREGGYEYKKISAGLQGIVLDEPGSDCGTKLTQEFEINGDTKDLVSYRYIVEDGKLVLLTPENIKDYMGKKVNLRSPMYCASDKICSKCAGELYYMMNLQNVGLTVSRVGTSLLNSSLKAFHDLSLKIVNINIEDYIN